MDLGPSCTAVALFGATLCLLCLNVLASDVWPDSGDQEGVSWLVAVGLGVGRWSLETAVCGPTLVGLVSE